MGCKINRSRSSKTSAYTPIGSLVEAFRMRTLHVVDHHSSTSRRKKGLLRMEKARERVTPTLQQEKARQPTKSQLFLSP